jgi:phytoene dehydrogenase-like protein
VTAAAHDVIVVGGGHNGLVAATVLAGTGLRTIVLERRPIVGGAAITGELHPGFRCPTLAHVAQPDADVLRELALAGHGLALIESDTSLFAPCPDGRSLTIGWDDEVTAASIGQFSEADARAYPAFRGTLARVTRFVAGLAAQTPPEIEQSSLPDLWSLLKIGYRLRDLGREDGYRLLRWVPMPAADFVSEWFESEPLRAAVAASGIFGTTMGPRSAGSTAVLLLRMATGDGTPRLVAGGVGAFSEALAAAARAAGVEIRTGCGVARIQTQNGRATGVVTETGETMRATAVVSNADPRRTLLELVEPAAIDGAVLARLRHYRSAGTVFKLNLALRGLPAFTAIEDGGDTRLLAGRIHIGPDLDYLERASDAVRYGRASARPYLDVTVPSLTDPALAPDGGHVMSICAQFAPYALREGDWAEEGARFANLAIDTLAAYAPNLRELIVHRQILTPHDLESEYGLTGGHIFHGEPALDQLFTMRPLLGWARYRTPVARLYLCGAGTHPGYGVSGRSGFNAAREILRDLAQAKA